MTSRALVQQLVMQSMSLENAQRKILVNNLKQARLNLTQGSNLYQRNLYVPYLDEVLKGYKEETIKGYSSSIAIEHGMRDGKIMLAEAANVPKGSKFYEWQPIIPVEAVSLADSNFAKLITNASDDWQTLATRHVQQSLVTGLSFDEMAEGLLGQGLQGSMGRDGIFRYATHRAETIARTTSNELINRGAVETYNQVDAINPELGLQKQWMTVSDRRTSDRCLNLSGVIVPLDAYFNAPDGWSGAYPPGHPNCRSRVGAISNRYRREYEVKYG